MYCYTLENNNKVNSISLGDIVSLIPIKSFILTVDLSASEILILNGLENVMLTYEIPKIIINWTRVC